MRLFEIPTSHEEKDPSGIFFVSAKVNSILELNLFKEQSSDFIHSLKDLIVADMGGSLELMSFFLVNSLPQVMKAGFAKIYNHISNFMVVLAEMLTNRFFDRTLLRYTC